MSTRTDMKVRIQGVLTRSNDNAVRSNTSNKIYDALKANGLKNFTTEKQWNQGKIEFNEQNLAFGGRNPALGILTALRDLVKSEGLPELGLEGKLLIIVDAYSSPVMVRVTVEDGKLRHQQATLMWEPELVS